VAAVVDWYGPTDFAAMDRQAPDDSMMCHDDPDSPESRLVGAPVQERPDLVARADPCQRATADAPPFLIMHGTRDRWVPFGQSEMLATRLRELGVAVDFRPIEGADHVFLDDPRGPQLVDEVVAFLVRMLHPGS
jgi:acetyl esterase/lipase